MLSIFPKFISFSRDGLEIKKFPVFLKARIDQENENENENSTALLQQCPETNASPYFCETSDFLSNKSAKPR